MLSTKQTKDLCDRGYAYQQVEPGRDIWGDKLLLPQFSAKWRLKEHIFCCWCPSYNSYILVTELNTFEFIS